MTRTACADGGYTLQGTTLDLVPRHERSCPAGALYDQGPTTPRSPECRSSFRKTLKDQKQRSEAEAPDRCCAEDATCPPARQRSLTRVPLSVVSALAWTAVQPTFAAVLREALLHGRDV